MTDRTVRVRLEAITNRYTAAMAQAAASTRALAASAAATNVQLGGLQEAGYGGPRGTRYQRQDGPRRPDRWWPLLRDQSRDGLRVVVRRDP